MTNYVKLIPMDVRDKKSRILGAARDAFIRHGYRRVTMGEIAAHAGMSRPALYLVFKDKAAIFRAVVEEMTSASLAEMQAGLSRVTTVRERLELMFDVWCLRPYERFLNAPDAQELMDAGHEVAGNEIAQGYAEFEAQLAAVFQPDRAALAQRNLDPDLLARTLSLALQGFKAAAVDAVDLRRLIGSLTSMALAAVGRDAAVESAAGE